MVAVEEEWLPIYAPSYCTFSNPLEDPPPSWNASLGQVMCYRTSTFGEESHFVFGFVFSSLPEQQE